MSFQPELMERENTLRTVLKVKIYPNSKQKQILRQFIGAYRFFYNKAIEYINNTDPVYTFKKSKRGKYILLDNEIMEYIDNKQTVIIADDGKKYLKVEQGDYTAYTKTFSFNTIRNKLRMEQPEWFKNKLPERIMVRAFKSAAEAYKACMAKFFKRGNKFKLQYKKRCKSITETIDIEQGCFSKVYNTIFAKWLGRNDIKSSKTFKNIKKCDSSLSYNRKTQDWSLNINYKTKEEENSKPFSCAAIDPGIRSFMTVYSPDNHIIDIGYDAKDKLLKECKISDALESKIAKKEKGKRMSLVRALHRQIKRIKNLKNELHNNVINSLTKLYKRIIYPNFKPSEMISNLNHITSRNMYNLSFYTFKNKLIYKCKKRNIDLIIGTEEYTSKTCTHCGNVSDIGSLKIYNCKKCKTKIDRDVNGARNILLKNNIW